MSPVRRERMLRWLFNCVIALEAVRMICWVIFLSYLAFGYSVVEGLENEAFVVVYMGSLYLGFPYSWLGSLLTSGIPIGPSSPVASAITQFLFWIIGSAIMIWVVWRIRLRARVRNDFPNLTEDQSP